jgi:Ran GTPase-activating protein (RanGAP) involved in mRNA processing and transport
LGEEGTKAICEALEQNKTLKELDISGNRHGNIGGSAGAKHVAKMLGVNGGLTKLSLAQNNLEEAGTKTICEALEQNTTLKELDISGHEYSNIGGSAGAKHVAKMVRVNGALTKLCLAQNKLEVEGTKAICEALEQNKTLKELDISGDKWNSNIGGSAGVKHVAKMLGVSGALTEVFAF